MDWFIEWTSHLSKLLKCCWLAWKMSRIGKKIETLRLRFKGSFRNTDWRRAILASSSIRLKICRIIRKKCLLWWRTAIRHTKMLIWNCTEDSIKNMKTLILTFMITCWKLSLRQFFSTIRSITIQLSASFFCPSWKTRKVLWGIQLLSSLRFGRTKLKKKSTKITRSKLKKKKKKLVQYNQLQLFWRLNLQYQSNKKKDQQSFREMRVGIIKGRDLNQVIGEILRVQSRKSYYE